MLIMLTIYHNCYPYFYTAQKVKFSNKDFFCKCDQIRSFRRIWSHLLKKSLMEKIIFCVVLLRSSVIV